MKERIIMLNIKQITYIHQSKNMRFYTVKDLLTNKFIAISSSNTFVFDILSDPNEYNIYICNLFQKGTQKDSVYLGMDVYYKLKTPCKSVLQKTKLQFAELFI